MPVIRASLKLRAPPCCWQWPLTEGDDPLMSSATGFNWRVAGRALHVDW